MASVESSGTFTLVPVQIGADATGRPIKTMTVSPGQPLIGVAKRRSPNATLLAECFEAVHSADPLTIAGRVAAPREQVRLQWAARKSDGASKSTISHGFKNAITASDFDEIEDQGVRYLASRQILGPPLSLLSPP